MRSQPPAAVATPAVPPPTLADDCRAAGVDPGRWVAGAVERRSLYVLSDPARVQQLAAIEPDRAARTISAADDIVRHQFNVLGSGPFVSIDPDRAERDGYRPIDWYLDPVRKLRFPRGIPLREWNLYEMRPGNADVKYPWDLARCYHWATLGQAWLLTSDSRFAAEMIHELDDFMEANPVGVGINWTCTMDVALRAVNWCIGLEMIHGDRAIDAAAWRRAFEALFDHGVFIRGNLEDKYEVTSNHYLSNLVGLWFLGAVFADLPQGQAWQRFARAAIEREIDVQVLPDGADFESSVPYHRLVTELFFGCLRLDDVQGASFSDHYRARVRDMVAYLAGVIRPDGLMPQLGDADDGRLHVLSDAGAWRPQDARHLFGPAGVLFDEAEWIALGGGVSRWEAAWWGMNVAGMAVGTGHPGPLVRLFPDAGHAVSRSANGHYLVATNAIVGTRGFGNHKHNDQLGFEYHVAGVPLLVDAGSFVYTSDADARNLFRSTRSQNPIEIDGIEQNDMKPEWLFRLFDSGRPEHVSFTTSGRHVEYVGRHIGYTRLPHPVTHERRLTLDLDRGGLIVHDRLLGTGHHDLRWHFHLAPGVTATRIAAAAFTLAAGPVSVVLHAPEGLTATVSEAWYSPSYGVRRGCMAIDWRTATDLGGACEWTFRFEPAS